MATSITWPPIGGSSFSIPAAGEVGWPSLSNFLIALQNAQSTESQKIAIRTATTTPVTVTSATDCVIRVELSVPGPSSVVLPAGLTGQYFVIVDGLGDASTNNITITPDGAETINGQASLVIDTDYGAYALCFRSSNWTIVGAFGAAGGAGSVPRSDIAAGQPDYVVINNNLGELSEEQYLSQSRGGMGANVSAFTGVVKASAGTFSASTIVDADIDATAGIDATKIADGSVTDTEFQYLGGVTSDIQTQLNAKIEGPVSSTNNALARWDSTGGDTLKDSAIVVDNSANATGFKTISMRNDDDLSAPTNAMIELRNENNAADSAGHVEFKRSRAGTTDLTNGDVIGRSDYHPRHNGNFQSVAKEEVEYTGNGTTRYGEFVWYTSDAGAPLERMRLRSSGALNLTQLTASRALYADASKNVQSSATTDTQLGYLSGTTGTTGTNALVLGTAPTLATPLIDDAADFEQITTPSNPAAGRSKIYPKTDGFFYTLDSSGTETQIGSGSGTGTGAINIIDNPSAVSNTTGWTAATNYTVTRLTSNSPLAGVVDTAFSIVTTTTSSESSTSGVYAAAQAMPVALRNAKNQVSCYVITPDLSLATWKVSVYNAGGTRMSLSSDSSGSTTLPGGFTGQFVATFDSDNTAQYTISFTQTAGSGGNGIIVTNIYIGNGITAQGAAISEWQSYTPTFSAGFGSVSTINFWYRRVGSDLEIQGSFLTGTVAGSTATFTLPNSLTVGNTAVAVRSSFGEWYQQPTPSAVGVYSNAGVVIATALGANTLGFDYQSAASTSVFTPRNGSSAFNSSIIVSLKCKVPIAEWAGNGTVNLGQGAQVEYAWNSDTSNASTTLSGFSYGPEGVAIGSYDTATRVKRVRFQYPIQATDQIELEIYDSSNGGRWLPANQSVGTSISATTGISLRPVNSTDVDVEFGSAGYAASVRAVASAWSGLGGTFRWRLKKFTPSAPVGFGLAGTDGSSGLYKAGQAPGYTGGTITTSGYLGYTAGTAKTATGGRAVNFEASTNLTTTPADVISVTLNKGVYLVAGCTSITNHASASNLVAALRIGSTAVAPTGRLAVGVATGAEGAITLPATPIIIETDGTVLNYRVQNEFSAGTTTRAMHLLSVITVA